MAILSLLATAAVLLLSGRVSAGVPGLFTPTSYEVVSGFFAQSLNSTSDATFDFTKSNFGLLDDEGNIDNSTDRWTKFIRKITDLNACAKPTESYKVLFLARHGEGFHNTAESFYGTPAWNCFWAEQFSNATTTWGPDALLTQNGINQALAANAAWKSQLSFSVPLPQKFLSSPLSRAASTLNLTWSDIVLTKFPFAKPVFMEGLRESIGLHTCDQRRSKFYLETTYPNYTFECHFRENDTLWGPVYEETSAQQTLRLRLVLDTLWAQEASVYVSVTAHSGTVAAILANVGHRGFRLQTGGMIPVVVRGFYEATKTTTTTPSLTSATAPACTANPSILPTHS